MRYLVILLFLAGCGTPQGQQILNQIGKKAAAEADASLGVSIWGTCKAPTAGALTRKWGSDPVAFRKWAEFCGYVTWPGAEPESKGPFMLVPTS